MKLGEAEGEIQATDSLRVLISVRDSNQSEGLTTARNIL